MEGFQGVSILEELDRLTAEFHGESIEHTVERMKELSQLNSFRCRKFSEPTRPIFIEATRATYCDVVSLVTTVAIIRDGNLKYAKQDVAGGARSMRRISPATGLYEEGVETLSRDQLNTRLKLEREVFMTALRLRRLQHMQDFRAQAVRIQSVFRRHLVWKQWPRTVERCKVRRELRELIIGQHSRQVVTTQRRYINKEEFIRHRCVCIIQHVYRLHKERVLVRTQKSAVEQLMNKMATRIQCQRRKSIARNRINSIVLDKYLSKFTVINKLGPFQLSILYRTTTNGLNVAASVIQRMYRTRKLRYTEELLREQSRVFNLRNTSATSIQKIFRGRKVRRHFRRLSHYVTRLQCQVRKFLAKLHVKRMQEQRRIEINRRNHSAMVIQKVVRSRLVRRRVEVTRQRLRLYKVFEGASKIQSIVRGFNSRRACSRLQAVRRAEEAWREEQRARVLAEREAEDQARSDFLASVADDIFYQTEIGQAVSVDRLFNDMDADPPRGTLDVNDSNETILLIAARQGYLEIVQRCVWWGFSLNHRNRDEESAVMLAVRGGHEQVVNFLLDLPTSTAVTSRDKYKPKALMIKSQDAALMTTAAARNGNTRLLKRLHNFGVPIDARLPTSGETALHIACEQNNIEAIRFLVSQKCSITTPDEKGVTALMKACASSSQATRILLGLSEESHILLKKLDREASSMLRVCDSEGKDCYTHAALNGRDDVLEMFQQLVLVAAASVNRSVSASVDEYEDVSSVGGKAKHSLHWLQADILKTSRLVEAGNTACVQWILAEGFHPNLMQEATGQTLLMVAAQHAQFTVIDDLLQRGANASIEDLAGRNCMHYAARCSSREVIAHLLNHPLAVKCKVSVELLTTVDGEGDTALHVAGRHGTAISQNVFSAETWVSQLRLRNSAGLTPLLEASKHQHPATVTDYLSYGALSNTCDEQGRDALWRLIRPQAHSSERREFRFFGKVVLALLSGGCSLYSSEFTGADAQLVDSADAGDFAVVGLDAGCLEELRDHYADSLPDLWRLVLSSMHFDTNSQVSIKALLNKANIKRIGSSQYQGYSLLGWAALLHNSSAISFLLASFKVEDPVDVDCNTCLHLAARYNDVEFLRVAVEHSKGRVDIDIRNRQHQSAATVGAQCGSFEAVKLLHRRYGASARVALDGKYWAWLLALAIKEVKNKNYDESNGTSSRSL